MGSDAFIERVREGAGLDGEQAGATVQATRVALRTRAGDDGTGT